MPPETPWTTHVVGVSYVAGYPRNLTRLDRVANRSKYAIPLLLRRNPANSHDHWAIEVHERRVGMLGHLSRDVAADLAPLMDAGQIWAAELAAVILDEEHAHPGLSIRVWRAERTPLT
jgi:hypothetical protein